MALANLEDWFESRKFDSAACTRFSLVWLLKVSKVVEKSHDQGRGMWSGLFSSRVHLNLEIVRFMSCSSVESSS